MDDSGTGEYNREPDAQTYRHINMSLTTIVSRAVGGLTLAVVLGACGSDPVVEAAGPPASLSCGADLTEMATLLRSGLATYDYNPAADLEALIGRSDLVLKGSFGSVTRSSGWTVIDPTSTEVLYPVADPLPAPIGFSISSGWPDGAGDDPIGEGVVFDDLSFVAFLNRFDAAPGGYAVDVQGLAVACTDSSETAIPIIESLPEDAAGLALPQLAELARVNGEQSMGAVGTGPDEPTPEGGVDAPSAPADDGLIVERGQPLGRTQVEPDVGAVKLWVSNQSFVDDPVHLTVSIDGVTVIDEPFDVEGQHNWIGFHIQGLAPGEHTVIALSDTGVESIDTFTLLADEPRWLVLDYWNDLDDPEGRKFTFDEFDHPVAFA